MIIRRLVLLAGLVSLFCTISAYAACTGSGLSFSCPPGASISDVQSALNAASDGAVISFAAGSYSWSSQAQFSNSRGVSLICASAGACNVTAGGTILGTSTYSGTNTHFYRISGFTFIQSSAGLLIWFGSGCSGCIGTTTQVRIDHNIFNMSAGGVAVFFGENSSVTNSYGVIDHNTMTSSGSAALLNMIGATNSSPPASPFGTANNMFVEDNTITITIMTDAGEGCMDSWGGAAIVWRHNTSTNCLVTAHGVTHAGGPSNIELYNNSINVNAGSSGQGVADCYRCFHHQGSGEFIAFNNSFTAYSGKNSAPLDMMHYCDFVKCIDGGLPQCDGTRNIDGNRSPTTTYRGYPCWHQPGRDFAANLKPMYVWNNTWSDTKAKIDMSVDDYGGSPDYFTNHMQANREWYNAVSASAQTSPTSPFNGTTGMGFGTLANRPTTCTTNSAEQGGGVGYFATDQGPQGTLYRCSSTNNWTNQYTPFTYPHPLVGNNHVAPPTGLVAVSQ